MQIDILLDVKTTLGEGPVWDVESQRLYFIDSMDGRVFRCTADGTELRAWDVPGKIGSMAVRKDGKGAIVSLDMGFWLLDFDSGDCELLHDPEADLATTRINDGKCDRRGRFFAGSMDMQEEGPLGALYRVDPDLSVTKLEDGIICSNGPCFSPDDKTFYFTDTWTGEIWAYDYDIETGGISNRRTFAKADTSKGGAADGATVDAEGYYWMALVYDGRICRFAPDGTLDMEIPMPVKKVTSVQFGGPDLDVLYVTSMAKPPLPRFPDDGVQRGSLFAIRGLGVKGVPEPRFGG
ncbi:calcium-binding protein [Thioclava sp. L04-15]|uniref:SMP-30/gluconolactonase/LRE family protein n=1 Tax=Thioclava sp. L04-15 TaxID=1915318 RepID=UPI0009988894|nr:SMP-30/gluconolactonase/LRE family protein [Thioclava sp. L04-15]OOY26381.1 calcium-binding protein [Thioclava sp. L04-15]TNE89879.1 MAG: SMP-30/gluconolactonase/LRE family protein [Paracoccaceae bacterium]